MRIVLILILLTSCVTETESNSPSLPTDAPQEVGMKRVDKPKTDKKETLHPQTLVLERTLANALSLNWSEVKDGILTGRTEGHIYVDYPAAHGSLAAIPDYSIPGFRACTSLEYEIDNMQVEGPARVAFEGSQYSIWATGLGEINIILNAHFVDPEYATCNHADPYPQQLQHRFHLQSTEVVGAEFSLAAQCNDYRLSEHTKSMPVFWNLIGESDAINAGMPEIKISRADGDVRSDDIWRSDNDYGASFLTISNQNVGILTLESEFGQRFDIEITPFSDVLDYELVAYHKTAMAVLHQELRPYTSLEVGEKVNFTVFAARFKEAHCSDQIRPILEIQTPDVCRLQPSTLDDIIVLRGESRQIVDQEVLTLKRGQCQISAKLASGKVVQSIDFDIE